MQSSLGSLVVVLFLVLQFIARPYIQDRMNILEALCAVSVFFYVFAAILFAEENLSGEESVRESTCAATIDTTYVTLLFPNWWEKRLHVHGHRACASTRMGSMIGSEFVSGIDEQMHTYIAAQARLQL